MSSQIHVKIDEKDKEKLDKIFKSVGLTTDEAFRMFVKKSIEVGGIPFELSTPNSRLEVSVKSKNYVAFDNAQDGLDWLND